MNYYYTIAGLADIHLSDTKVLSMTELAAELEAVLSRKDLYLFQLLRMKYDNQHLLALLQGREEQAHPLAVMTDDDWNAWKAAYEEEAKVTEKRKAQKTLLTYFQAFYAKYTDNQQELLMEDILAAEYYACGMTCRNKFLAEWFEFNLNLNNLLVAITCKKQGWDLKKRVVGNNEVAKNLRTSNARDFDLADLFEQYEEVARIAEMADLLEREKKLDALKWNWLEDHIIMSPFSVEKLLAFWLQCELLQRWDGLTTEKGRKVFQDMMDDFKKEVKFQ